MTSALVGTGHVDIVPNAEGFFAKLTRQIGPEADAAGKVAGKAIGDQIADGIQRGALVGFAKVAAEAKALPAIKLDVDVEASGAVAHLAGLSAAAHEAGGNGRGGIFSRLASSASNAFSEVGALAGELGPMKVGLAALVPVAIAAGAALGGVAVALAAPIGAAALGGGLFAFLAGKMISRTAKVAKQIEDLRKKAATLNDPKAAAKARAQADALEKSLTGPQRAFVAARSELARSFSTLTRGKAGDALIAPVAAGMRLLVNLLPRTTPLIQSVSRAFTGLINDVERSAGKGGFDRLIRSLSKLAGPAITKIGHALGSAGSAIRSVLRAASKTGVSALDGIANGLARFSRYLQSPKGQQKLQSFFDWLQKNGPAIGQSIVSIAHDAATLASALGKVVGPLSKAYNFLRKIPGLVNPLANALSGFGVGSSKNTKNLKDVQKLGQAFTRAGGDARKLNRLAESAVKPRVLRIKGDTKRAESGVKKVADAAKGLKPKKLSITAPTTTKVSKDVAAVKKNTDALKAKKLTVSVNNLSTPIRQANSLADAIARVKSKSVTVTTTYKTNGTPPAASGRLVTGPQKILVGEAGPEAIVPLNRDLSRVDPAVRWLSAIAQGKSANRQPGRRVASSGGGASTRPITMNGSIVGLLRETARGEAQLVFNEQAAFAGTVGRMS